jgi:hypothetical protein
MRIEFNKGALERLVKPAIVDMARDLKSGLARLRATHEGRSPDEIKPAVRALFQRDGGSIDEDEVAKYAQLISAGTEIKVQADGMRW